MPELRRGQGHHEEPVLQDRERHDACHQAVGDDAERIRPRGGGLLDQKHQCNSGQCHGKGEQQIHRTLPEEALQVMHVLRDELLVQVADAEKHVQPRALMHPCKHQESPKPHLVCRAPGDGDYQASQYDDGDLVVEADLQRVTEMPPATATGGAGMTPRTGDVTHVEADLEPAPDQEPAGKGEIGSGGRRVIDRARQPVDCRREDQRRREHAPAERPLRQPVQIDDHPGTEPPEKEREEHGQQIDRHCPALPATSL